MIERITLAKIAPKYTKVKKASNELLARTHYVKYLREEQKFFDNSCKLEGHIRDWSLKSIPDMIKSLIFAGKMAKERLKSAYYFQKIK